MAADTPQKRMRKICRLLFFVRVVCFVLSPVSFRKPSIFAKLCSKSRRFTNEFITGEQTEREKSDIDRRIEEKKRYAIHTCWSQPNEKRNPEKERINERRKKSDGHTYTPTSHNRIKNLWVLGKSERTLEIQSKRQCCGNGEGKGNEIAPFLEFQWQICYCWYWIR